ncbi:MAG: 4Fe-4S dicluster domain-containing protein [Chloroflexi bacterium]|nr:4Fe-4S dicluster domain-containing protein [Chloroflexota bacterium]MCI0728865.1 4Fe-4S dicluster domain-containing protein [Chloroflexota bacterium]
MASGRIVIDVERCKGCELCRAACPPEVIGLAEQLNGKGYRPVILLDPEHNCTGCALCAVACPEACITVYRDVAAAGPRRAREDQRHAQTVA